MVTDKGAWTYAELVRRAEDLAANLQRDHANLQLRFAIDSADADVVVPALAAAALVGAEACVFPPDGPETAAELLSRFGQHVVVRRGGESWAEVSAGSLEIAAGAEGLDKLDQRGSGEIAAGTARPHLVLTTGTTGQPRGVRHDWSRLLRATERVQPAEDERWLLAYGLHQFAGLQVLLHVFAAGATLVAPTQRRPREGLVAMREHDVTHASATPTYWRFLLAELRSVGGPVPALRQITLGGEAAPGPVLEQIRRRFPTANLSHIYAASEFGATSSTKDGLPGLPADVLARGDEADIAMKIVDGELWVRSRVGMLGYHGEEPVAADEWRATGDLVELQGDRILFKGRVSEIINVGGVKVHPLPIEEAVAAVPGVQVARVFGRPNAMTGAIVAVEVVTASGADPDAVKAAVRAACADLPAAARPRSVKVVDEVDVAGERSSGGAHESGRRRHRRQPRSGGRDRRVLPRVGRSRGHLRTQHHSRGRSVVGRSCVGGEGDLRARRPGEA